MSANASSAVARVTGGVPSPRPASSERVVVRRKKMTATPGRARPPVRTETRARASTTTNGGRENLREGSRGEEAYRLQQRLAEEGVLSVEDVTGCVRDAMRCALGKLVRLNHGGRGGAASRDSMDGSRRRRRWNARAVDFFCRLVFVVIRRASRARSGRRRVRRARTSNLNLTD